MVNISAGVFAPASDGVGISNISNRKYAIVNPINLISAIKLTPRGNHIGSSLSTAGRVESDQSFGVGGDD